MTFSCSIGDNSYSHFQATLTLSGTLKLLISSLAGLLAWAWIKALAERLVYPSAEIGRACAGATSTSVPPLGRSSNSPARLAM